MEIIKFTASRIETEWPHILEKAEGSGRYPIIVGSSEFAENVVKAIDENAGDIEKNLKKAEDLDGGQWLIDERERQLKEMAAMMKKFGDDPDDFEKDLLGKWPKGVSGNENNESLPGLNQTIFRGVDEAGVILLPFPEEEAWKAPCYIGFGGWDDVPPPWVQSAVHRHWQEKYGSLVYAVTDSIILASIDKPVSDRDEAIKLAWEHYYYCNDRVMQGSDTVSRLAAELLDASQWFFWFD